MDFLSEFIDLVEKIKLPKGVILVSVVVMSLYTNIPQEEEINIVYTAYEAFCNDMPPACSLKEKKVFAAGSTALTAIQFYYLMKFSICIKMFL